MDTSYYVYVAKVDGEVVYVGSGKGERYKHVTSGKSHSGGLNFINRQGIIPCVEIVSEGMTKVSSRAHEQDMIDTYKPAFNKGIAAKASSVEDYKELSKIQSDTTGKKPSREILSVANLLFSSAYLRQQYDLIQASFALSKAKEDGSITYTQSQLDSFVASFATDFIGLRTTYFEPTKILLGDPVFNTHVSSIMALFNHEDSLLVDWAGEIRANIKRYDRSKSKYLVEMGQLNLFDV
jgi:hypothetical protein